MSLVRSAGATLTLALILVMLASTTALASEPKFVTAETQVEFNGTSGRMTVSIGGTEQECSSDQIKGIKILGAKTTSGGKVTYQGCKTLSPEGVCTVKSVGATNPGEIVTNTLKGELGTVKGSEAASGVGLLLEPETAKVWFKLAANTCAPETAITGTLAGEVSPTMKSQLTGKLIFAVTSGKQEIRKIGILGKVTEPTLDAFGEPVPFESSESLTFASAVEVT